MLALNNELEIRPFRNLCALAPGPAKERQFRRASVHVLQRLCQIHHKLIRTREADLRKMNTERTHPLQQVNCAGYGNLEVGLLQSVAETGIEQLHLRRLYLIHSLSA